MSNKRVLDAMNEEICVTRGFEYKAPTKKGDCGSVLYLYESTSRNMKILGFHTAGNNDAVGFSSCLCKEDIMKLLNSFGDQISDKTIIFESQSKAFDRTPFVPLYHVKKPVGISTNTKLTSTPLIDSWRESTTKPAMLHRFTNYEGDFIDPMRIAQEKYSIPRVYLDPKLLSMAGHDCFRFLANNPVDVLHGNRTLFSFDQAVIGIPGKTFCDAIPRNTSAGYPFCEDLTPGHRGKETFFGKEELYNLTGPKCDMLRARVKNIIDNARNGVRTLNIFKDFLKDELRPFNKVEQGNSRLVSGAPLDYVIAWRMYFLDFQMDYMTNRISNHSAVGINVYSDEWQRLYKYLMSQSENVFAGDQKGFDGRHGAQIATEICDGINAWYGDGDENAKIRKVLFLDLYNSRHIIGDLVVQWDGSLPSGHPFTTIFNTLVTDILFRMSFGKIMGIYNMDKFDDTVCLIGYGDDNIGTIDDFIIDRYNQVTIAKEFLTFGYVYTPEDKTSDLVPYRSIKECNFLKRNFRFESIMGRMVAPLSLDTILEMAFWTKKGQNAKQITLDNVDNCLSELSLHDRETFQFWSKLIVMASKDLLNYTPNCPNQEVLLIKCSGWKAIW
jgi:hypothetical protein